MDVSCGLLLFGVMDIPLMQATNFQTIPPFSEMIVPVKVEPFRTVGPP